MKGDGAVDMGEEKAAVPGAVFRQIAMRREKRNIRRRRMPIRFHDELDGEILCP